MQGPDAPKVDRGRRRRAQLPVAERATEVFVKALTAHKLVRIAPDNALAVAQLEQAQRHRFSAKTFRFRGFSGVMWVAVAEMEAVALSNALFAMHGVRPTVELSERDRLMLLAAATGRSDFVSLPFVGTLKNQFEHGRVRGDDELPNGDQSTDFWLARAELNGVHEYLCRRLDGCPAPEIEVRTFDSRWMIPGGREPDDRRTLARMADRPRSDDVVRYVLAHFGQRMEGIEQVVERDVQAAFFLGYNWLLLTAQGIMASLGRSATGGERHRTTAFGAPAFGTSEAGEFERLDGYRRLRNALRHPWRNGGPIDVDSTVVELVRTDLARAQHLIEAQFDVALLQAASELAPRELTRTS